MSNVDFLELNQDTEYIECATIGLIREYLARKGLRQALETFDEENPKIEKSLNSRTKLIDYLGAQKLYEKNKSLKTPFKTILELLISFHSANINKDKEAKSKEAGEMNFRFDKKSTSNFRKNIANDLQIDDTNEGEVYDGQDKRIDSKNLEKEKVEYDFKFNKSKPSNVKKLESHSSQSNETNKASINGFKGSSVEDTFESKLEERARKLKEKNESDKNDLLKELKLNEEKPSEQPKRTFQKPKPEQIKTGLAASNISPLGSEDSKEFILKPINFETAKSIRMLLFGNLTQTFSNEWKSQGFNFSDITKLKFGIVQKKGGPCGVLASVQSYVLLDLIFSSDEPKEPNMIFNVNKKDRSRSLAKGLAHLIWKCGQTTQQAILVTYMRFIYFDTKTKNLKNKYLRPTQQAHFPPVNKYKSDGITETLNLLHFNNFNSLESYLIKNVNLFEQDGSNGCILLLYSAILSRTVEKIMADMDVAENKLMGMHGYCTQEMVNLLIHGRAVSNVFNDSVFLDQLELRGPNKRNDIGFLSLFEHYKSCEVGSYYKTPKYPIWVVCSESHFSVIFAIRKDIMSDWRAETCFDLYYYDGLAKQDEQIKLTLSSAKENEDPFFKIFNKAKKSDKEKELIPPLELVLKTKWKEASVNWNSTEPIL